MNISEMKAALGRFRNADVSVIKDEKLRVKAQKLQAKQGGFTLLELLVVITLLAVLSTAALIAYEGVGENAEAVAGANTAATIDRAIRTYKAVEGEYPDQWDNLTDMTTAASAIEFAPAAFNNFLGAWTLNASSAAIVEAGLEGAGIEELQYTDGLDTGVAPNRGHNESANGQAQQMVLVDAAGDPTGILNGQSIAVIPTSACSGAANAALGTALPTATFDGSVTAVSNSIQNSYADILESDACHIVAAFGFGGDSAASTSFSRVAIAQSPTYGRQGAVDPSTQYARYIGLFHFGEYDDVAGAWEFRDAPRLLAVVAPDGSRIDDLVAQSRAQP